MVNLNKWFYGVAQKIFQPNWQVALILIVIGLITFIPLFRTGLTTYDDLSQQLLALDDKFTFFEISKSFANSQGRFYFLYSGLVLLLPYSINSWWFIKGVGLGSVFLNLLLLSVLNGKIFKSKEMAYLSLLLGFVLMQNSWEHNLLNAYPLVFTLSVSLLLFSLILLFQYLEKSNLKLLVMSGLFYFFALLSYETFLLYLPIYFIVVFFKFKKPVFSAQNLIKIIKITSPYLISVGGYLAAYYLFQQAHPSGYDGNQIKGGSVGGFFKTIWIFGKSSLPFSFFLDKYYRTYLNTYNTSLLGDRRNPISIILTLNSLWLIKGLLVSYLSFKIFNQFKTNEQLKKFILVGLVSAAYIFLPITFIAMINKYQSWATGGGAIAFTATYFSYLALISVFVGLTGAVIHFTRRQFILNKIIIFIMVASLFSISVIHDYMNEHVTISQRQASLKWDAVRNLIGSSEFSDIPNNSLIYAPSIYNYMIVPTYWQQYIKVTSGKTVTVTDKAGIVANYFENYSQSATPAAYLLDYHQEPVDEQDYLVFAQITNVASNSANLELWTNKITIFSRGKYKKYLGVLPLKNDDKIKIIKIDGLKHLVDENTLFFTINKQWPGQLWSKATLETDSARVDRLVLSHYFDLAVSNSRSVDQVWSNGCFEKEGSDADNWHWCTTSGQLKLINTFNRPIQVVLMANLKSGFDEDSNLAVSFLGVKTLFKINNQNTKFEKKLILKPGENLISFESDAARYAPIDPRDIRFGVFNFTITEQLDFNNNSK